jgi:hypothetical protein
MWFLQKTQLQPQIKDPSDLLVELMGRHAYMPFKA